MEGCICQILTEMSSFFSWWLTPMRLLLPVSIGLEFTMFGHHGAAQTPDLSGKYSPV